MSHYGADDRDDDRDDHGADPLSPYRRPQDRGADRRNVLIVLGVVAGGVILGGLVFAGLVAFWISGTTTTEATEQDLAVLVTAGDLAAHFPALEVDPDAEFATRTRFFDGSYDLDYEYDHPDEDWPLTVHSTASVEVSESDAGEAFTILVLATSTGFSLAAEDGVEKREDNEFFSAGDKSRHFVLQNDGEQTGHMLFVRIGKRVFSLFLAGACFEDPEGFRELVAPKLAALRSYDPAVQDVEED